MRNIWFILRRDLKRLIINPAAWVIIFGLTFIPALYAWFNIIGFWNPYGNTKRHHRGRGERRRRRRQRP